MNLLEFIEKCTVKGEPLKLQPFQKRLIENLRGKKIKLKPRSGGASRLGISTLRVMTAGAEEKPVLGHDAFMTSPVQHFEYWEEFADWPEGGYVIGFDPGAPEGDKGIAVFSGSKGENAWWYLDAGLEPLLVEGPHPFPKDSFEWHENETWWLSYARKEGIDITTWFPIFVA